MLLALEIAVSLSLGYTSYKVNTKTAQVDSAIFISDLVITRTRSRVDTQTDTKIAK